MAKKKQARARPTAPALAPPDPRQLTIGETPDAAPPTRKPAAKALPADQGAAMAQRAVGPRVDPATGRVVIRVSVRRAAAEQLARRAIRESRNLEDLSAELLEGAAQPPS